MDDVFNPFTFVSLQQVLDSLHPGMFLSVLDLQFVYRSVALCPDERPNFGLLWQSSSGALMVLNDNFLCFGTHTTPPPPPAIFDALSQAIVHMITHRENCVGATWMTFCAHRVLNRAVETLLN